MRKTIGIALVIMVCMALSVDGFAADKKSTGFLGDYYGKMQKGPEGGAQKRWLKPGVDFSRYDKVMLESVVFYFDPTSEDNGVDPEVMKELSDAFNLELVNALKDKYPIVSEPGPDVIRVRIALTGLKQSRPVISGVTSIVPVGLAISVVKKGATGSWSGSGVTGAELMAIDSMSNEVIAAAQDNQTAAFAQRFTKYGSANEAFKFWAGRLRTFLDEEKSVK